MQNDTLTQAWPDSRFALLHSLWSVWEKPSQRAFVGAMRGRDSVECRCRGVIATRWSATIDSPSFLLHAGGRQSRCGADQNENSSSAREAFKVDMA